MKKPIASVLLTILTLPPLLVSTSPSRAAKPGTIHGIVEDESDSPLPNVSIELVCLRDRKTVIVAKTESNATGDFRFEDVLWAGCKVKLTTPGFTSRVVLIANSAKDSLVDLGKIRLSVSCSGPGVICDEVTPIRKHPNDE